MTEHVDVVVVGAGLSGIGAAVHLRKHHPQKKFAILEARDSIGGTWDLFRYPGIRSDSDMFTLGYRFKPWLDQKAIADGPSILRYVKETAEEHDVTRHIRFGHRVVRASWSSEAARWTVEAEREGQAPARITCSFLWACSGYYDYDAGYTPDFPGIERYRGKVVHPQHWDESVEYRKKKVVVIGSGATAMTLVPELAKDAAHVVMLQRSPTYVVSLPAEDVIANTLRKLLPATAAYDITRWKNVLLGMAFFQFARRRPAAAKKRLLGLVREALGPHYDLKHFTPSYGVWDQRLCLVPDADLFVSLKEGRASVVTDHIETFTEDGIRLRSGETLTADLVVTATGLVLRFLGGMELVVDGKKVVPNETTNYKGSMFSDVPNLACTFGYTNASWTLKADLTSELVCRILAHMDATGTKICTPRLTDPSVEATPFLGLQSGYVQRALDRFPKQGNKMPWRLYQNYLFDIVMMRHGRIDDGALEFTGAREPAALPITARAIAQPN